METMIVDASDPSSAKEVSMWWVPGSRKGERPNTNKWIWSKLVPSQSSRRQTRSPASTAQVYVQENRRRRQSRLRSHSAATVSSYSICPIPSIRKKLAALNPPRNIPAWALPSTPSTAASSIGGFVHHQRLKPPTPIATRSICELGLDIRDESHPVPVAQLPRPVPPPEAPSTAIFCFKARTLRRSQSSASQEAPGKPRQEFIAYSYFIAGLRC